VTEQQPVIHGGVELVDRGLDVGSLLKFASLDPRPQQAGRDLPARTQPLLLQGGANVGVGLAGGHQIGHQRPRIAVAEEPDQRQHLGSEDLLKGSVLIDRQGVPGSVKEAFEDHVSP
jgi:hypothetical protein